MSNFYELAKGRRSIRKFSIEDIPNEDIEYFIKAATVAPSGCNSQNWNFVAVKNTEIIKKLEVATLSEIDNIFSNSEVTSEYIDSKKKAVSFFKKAPLVIVVFMTEASYYDNTFLSLLKSQGLTHEEIMKFFGNYDILSIGAAIQNLLLAIHEKGYGACWMNDPVVAGSKINEILGVPREQKLISIIPVGKPAYAPRDKKMKEFNEIFKLVE